MPEQTGVFSSEYLRKAKRVYIDFGIFSDILDPFEINQVLGCTPDQSWRKGEKYLGKTYDPESKVFSQIWREKSGGAWHLETRNKGLPDLIEPHIVYLLGILEPSQDQLFKYLAQRDDYFIRFFIHCEPVVGEAGLGIESSLIKRMASLCHEMEISCMAGLP
jgi:hypothetical protein